MVHEQAGPHLWFLILNAKEGPFADKRVRQAINYAIDKEAIVDDVLQGTATVAPARRPGLCLGLQREPRAISLRSGQGARPAGRSRRLRGSS